MNQEAETPIEDRKDLRSSPVVFVLRPLLLIALLLIGYGSVWDGDVALWTGMVLLLLTGILGFIGRALRNRAEQEKQGIVCG